MTTEEIEAACNAAQVLDFTRHSIEAPELSLQQTIYPFGFPAVIRTNSRRVLSLYEEAWRAFEKRRDTEAIRIDVHIVETDAKDCPLAPGCQILYPLVVSAADQDNYFVTDLSRTKTQIVASTASLRHEAYLRYFFLDAALMAHIATRFTTPVHAACVAMGGRGALLCGDSGAGKSTLSYACARAGFGYVADDSIFLLDGGDRRLVTGNCYQLRLRPSAAELFPEIAGREITPRAAGKPSIELLTSPMGDISRVETVPVDYLIFLNRSSSGPPALTPYRKDVARQFMRQVLYGLPEQLARQYNAVEQLLTAQVLQLHYTEFNWAVERLRTLMQRGQ